MARTIRDTNLDSRDARNRLPVRGKPYYRIIDEGLHIGYRKGKKARKWVARIYDTTKNGYEVITLANADDFSDADGNAVLSWSQAQAEARKRRDIFTARRNGFIVQSGPYTVAKCMADYIEDYNARGKAASTYQNAIDNHILPTLGDIDLEKLTAHMLTTWRNKIANQPAKRRSTSTPNLKPLDKNDPEQVRQRQATTNRILSILKAALNHAWKMGYVSSDTAWRRVKPFQNVELPKIRFLTLDESIRLVNACSNDSFRNLVKGALYTGCRYGELARLKASDFQPDQYAIFLRHTKNGKSRTVYLTKEGFDFFSRITAEKQGDEYVFTRPNGNAWKTSEQIRPIKEACKNAGIDPAISFHILRHTYASHLVMNGIALQVVAESLGHSSTRITEKHYAHLAPSYVAEQIKLKAPQFNFEDNKVVKLRLNKISKDAQSTDLAAQL